MKASRNMRWIIDCDPGCDDAVAIALAAGSLNERTPVELLSVAGNVDVELTTWNACRITNACGKKWSVYRGCKASLSGEAVPASSVHGKDGLGDVPNNAFNIRPRAPRRESAVQRYLKLGNSNAKFVLVCTGPLTNLASALNLMSAAIQQSFWRRCEICIIMGGAFETQGNITASAEFNTHFDPVATHLVLESWRAVEASVSELRPIHFVPLDVTELVGIPLHEASDSPDNPSSPAARFLLPALRKYGIFHSRCCQRPQQNGGGAAFGISELDEDKYLKDRLVGKSGQKHLGAFCYLHDPLAVWAALKREEADFGKWWSETHIAMDISHGAGRGRLIVHSEEKARATPSRIRILGTNVRWLDPGRFSAPERSRFVAHIKRLLGLKEPKGKSVRIKAAG